LEQNKSRDI